MHAIEIHAVSKYYGQKKALDDVSFHIDANESCVLFGCSGAGKSTLLRLISGLDSPDCGSIRLAGQEVTQLPPSQRSVSLVFQDTGLYPHLSLRKNLLVALQRLRLDGEELNARIGSVLQNLGIAHLEERLPSQISGGEAQRAAFARALVVRPNILLLDEPLSQLDGLSKLQAIELLEEVKHRFHPTMVIVSHDPLDAFRLADRIALMHEGRLIDHGLPEQLYRAPSSRLSGHLLSPFGMNWLDRNDPALAGTNLPTPRGQFLGFRPEDVRIGGDGSTTPCLQLKMTVQSARRLGFTNLVSGTCEDQTLHLLTGCENIQPGKLQISVPHEALCWVDQ